MGKTFFINRNKNITAIISGDVWYDMAKIHEIHELFSCRDSQLPHENRWRANVIYGAADHLRIPTFTFQHNVLSGQEDPWVTGSEEELEALIHHIEKTGGKIVEREGWYIPFSNGSVTGIHGKEAMAREFKYITTTRQFRDTFGISRAELLARIRNSKG